MSGDFACNDQLYIASSRDRGLFRHPAMAGALAPIGPDSSPERRVIKNERTPHLVQHLFTTVSTTKAE